MKWNRLDAVDDAKTAKADEDYERYAQEECEAEAREDLGETATYEEIDEYARELFRDNLDDHVDTCKCSDPGCPCSGLKKGSL